MQNSQRSHFFGFLNRSRRSSTSTTALVLVLTLAAIAMGQWMIPASGFSQDAQPFEPQNTPPRKATPDPYFNPTLKPQKLTPAPTDQSPTSPVTNPPSSAWVAPLTPIPPKPSTSPSTTSPLEKPSNNRPSPSNNTFAVPDGLTRIPVEQPLSEAKPQNVAPPSIIRQRTDDQTTPPVAFPQVSQSDFKSSVDLSQPETEASENRVEPFETGKVLALVGGEPIFVGDMMFEINQMIEQRMPTAPESIKQKARQTLIPNLLPKFVEAKILFQGAAQKLPEEVDLESVIEQAGAEFDKKALPEMMESSGVKSIPEFDAQLRAQGSSLRRLRRSWSIDQLTKIFVGQRIANVAEVTHREMLEQYQKDLSKYSFPAKAKWEQIMIRFDKSKSRDEAKSKIESLTDKVVKGANLSALAKEESHGYLASTGGQHDWTTQGSLVWKEVDDAIFNLPIGELSAPIRSEAGYHVIRVVERREAGRTSFLEAQVEIKKSITEARRRDAFAKYLEELKDVIPVEYIDN